MSSCTTSPGDRLYKVKTKGIDVFSSDSGDDNLASKLSLLDADRCRPYSAYRFGSNSVDPYRRRAEKVSTGEKKEDEISQKPESEEEKVGDMVRFGRKSYFVIDIFEKEIMELGDKVDLNFKTFNKFEAVDGGAPWDHQFYSNRCCYSCCCVCASSYAEKEWGILKRELDFREKEGVSKGGVSFFVRTYNERKELMRVAVTAKNGDLNHSLFFFDIKFPTEYPYQAPSFFYHPHGLPLFHFETHKSLEPKLRYNMLDLLLHIEKIVMMNTNWSSHQMLDMLKRPLMGFEDFVKGHFRKKGAFILRNMMDEVDFEKETDKNRFFKTYIAFEDNKTYCEHLLNSDLKQELERFKEKECSLSDHYYHSSPYFPTITSRFDDIQKTSRYQNLWNKFLFLLF